MPQQEQVAQGGEVDVPILRIERLSKTFGGTRALVEASLEIVPGEIHALVGQNGSGKSTLIKVLADYHQPDPGAHGSRRSAVRAGHAGRRGERAPRFVHQISDSSSS
jgi:ribose transport system ATP-binding protein